MGRRKVIRFDIFLFCAFQLFNGFSPGPGLQEHQAVTLLLGLVWHEMLSLDCYVLGVLVRGPDRCWADRRARDWSLSWAFSARGRGPPSTGFLLGRMRGH